MDCYSPDDIGNDKDKSLPEAATISVYILEFSASTFCLDRGFSCGTFFCTNAKYNKKLF